MTNENPFRVGDRVALVNHPDAGAPFWGDADDEGTVTEVAGTQVKVEYDGSKAHGHHHEWVRLVKRETERPTVLLTKQTSLDYAKAANSRVLKPQSQETLKAAAAGFEVDAYALNAALTDAMSSAATRHGQSMGRRELTRKIRHLAYIVQAVLENHADGLPAYEIGERSRHVEALKAANLGIREQREQAKRDLAEAQDVALAAINETEKTAKALTEYKDAADAEFTRLGAAYGEVHQKLQAAEREREAYAQGLAYALERLDLLVGEKEAQRVLGFLDAVVEDGTTHTFE